MTLSGHIYAKIGQHVGRENAIKRKALLEYLYDLGVIDEISESTDREVRLIIEINPLICSGPMGYFIAKDSTDYKIAIDSIVKRIRALNKKIKKKEEAYPQFVRQGQMDLF